MEFKEKYFKESEDFLNNEIERLILKINKRLLISPKIIKKLDYIKVKDLKTIHTDKETAKELILIIVNNFSHTLASSLNSDDKYIKQGFKRLSSKILQKQVDTQNSNRYKKILKVLEDYKIIERGRNYSTDYNVSNEYKLTSAYFKTRVTDYTLNTSYGLKMAKKWYRDNFERVISTYIGRNEIINQSRFELPSIELVEKHLKTKSKEGYKNKRGKRLVTRGKNTKKYNDKEYVFIEDYLDLYDYLYNYMELPIITDENAGHRIITKYNMMPSVIRELITIDDKNIFEADYSCLHPNIANRIYRGSNSVNIDHQEVADYLGISRKEAKIEHLSFFNKKIKDMKRSPLYKYYTNNHFELLYNVENDKIRHKTHKITSQKLFLKETEVMEEVAKVAYNEGIEFFYVFDAMYTTEDDLNTLKGIMNRILRLHKIKTTV